jgi:hypothetical protein
MGRKDNTAYSRVCFCVASYEIRHTWRHFLSTSHVSQAAKLAVFVYIPAMAQISKISSIASFHGKKARANAFAIIQSLIKSITRKTITKR